MTTDVIDPKPPEPPSVRHMIAVVLEMGILATFVSNHSYFGVALCGAYAWYSATWALFRKQP